MYLLNHYHSAYFGGLDKAGTIYTGTTSLNQGDFNYLNVKYFSFNFPFILIFFWSLKKSESYNCGSTSTKALKKYIGRKIIKCDYTEKDRYGRILGTCYLWKDESKKLSLNRYMVFTGNAVAYKRYSKEYLKDEKWAKNNQLGMWQGKFIRPEEWRRKTK